MTNMEAEMRRPCGNPKSDQFPSNDRLSHAVQGKTWLNSIFVNFS
jgi:hypothetical protein